MDLLAQVKDHPIWGWVYVELRTQISKDIPPNARNVTDHEPGGAAFFEVPSIYPVTITQARYGGTYEGGAWLAFPCYPHVLDKKVPDWAESDIECSMFWIDVSDQPDFSLIGRGASPTEAYNSLVELTIRSYGA